MSEHSPTPWKFDKGLVWDKDTLVVASVVVPAMTQEAGAVHEANGHLMAAAPDMLAALQKIVHGLHPKDWRQAREAIAKAEGKHV